MTPSPFTRRATYQLYEPPLPGPLPVILFLHGAGESGTDGVLPTTVGLGPAVLRDPQRFPSLIVFPQAEGHGWTGRNLDAAIAALDDVMQNFAVDEDRVYVTGISMGGYGTWLMASNHPERFAAAVPICGGVAGDRERTAQRLAQMPQWIFHGDADDIIKVSESRTMVAALRNAGAPIRYTEYAGVGHNSWDRAYAEPELMPWLLAQRRR
jgi:predicted peptidase